jgi:hypothetical protein
MGPLSEPTLTPNIESLADNDDVRTAGHEVDEAKEALEVLQMQVPSNRYGYRIIEGLIDFVRISPPVIIGALALWNGLL